MGPRHGRWPPSWRCISRVDAMPGVPSTISNTPGRMPCGAMPIRRRSPISPRGWRCWRRSPRPRRRAQQELDLQIALGPAFVVTRGSAPRLWNRSTPGRTSCASRWGRPHSSSRCCGASGGCIITAASTRRARALGEQLLSLAQQVHDAALLLEAHHALWATLFVFRRVDPCPSPPGAGEGPLRSPAAPRICLALWRP